MAYVTGCGPIPHPDDRAPHACDRTARVPKIPPVVLCRTAGGVAYLLGWQQLPDGTWGAEVAWMEWDGLGWRGRRERVTADDIDRIEGQDYSGVPRREKA